MDVSNTKCLACCGEYIVAKNKGDETLPMIEDAITWAPSWQSQNVGGQMVMSCVPAPTCMRHLNASEETPMQRAMRGGLLLGGQSPQ